MRGGGAEHGEAQRERRRSAGGESEHGTEHPPPHTQTERSGADGGRNRGVVHTDEHGAPHPPVDNFSGLTTPLRVGDPQVWIFTFPSPL